jgi:transposase, IS5 family
MPLKTSWGRINKPIIGHLKADYHLTRNLLKGTAGDLINVLDGRARFNLWMSV